MRSMKIMKMFKKYEIIKTFLYKTKNLKILYSFSQISY